MSVVIGDADGDGDFDSFDYNETKGYGFPLIFMFNLLQSLFFLVLFVSELDSDRADYFYRVEKVGDQNKDYISTFLSAIFFLAIVLLIGKKIFEKYCRNCFCSLIMIIIFLFFKLVFIPFVIGFINVEIFKTSLHKSAFVYWCAATSLFYLAFFITSFIKNDIKIFSLIGLTSCVIFAIPAYIHSKDIISACVCFGLSIIELIFLIGSIWYAEKEDNLEKNQSINNLFIIDNYKYFVVLIILALILYLIFIIICCIGGCFGGERGTPYYRDQFGNLYDINKNRI